MLFKSEKLIKWYGVKLTPWSFAKPCPFIFYYFLFPSIFMPANVIIKLVSRKKFCKTNILHHNYIYTSKFHPKISNITYMLFLVSHPFLNRHWSYFLWDQGRLQAVYYKPEWITTRLFANVFNSIILWWFSKHFKGIKHCFEF